MTEKITGTVQAVSQKEKTFGIRIKDQWYNGFGQTKINKGDIYEIEFTTKEVDGRIFRNITKANRIEEETKEEWNGTYPTDKESKVVPKVYHEDEKNRRCAIIKAVDFVMATQKTENMDIGQLIELITQLAKAFESYISKG